MMSPSESTHTHEPGRPSVSGATPGDQQVGFFGPRQVPPNGALPLVMNGANR